MSGRSTALVAFVAVGVSILGCNLGESSTHSCPRPPEGGCQRSTFTTAMTEGSITYRARSTAPSTSEVLRVSDDASTQGCTVSGMGGEILQDETVITLGPGIFCGLPDGYLYVSLLRLADFRSWPLGTHSFRASLATDIELCDHPGGAGRGCTMCRPQLDDVLMTVVVEEAEGGPAPYPTMVTPDYRRRYRIELDTGALSTDDCDGLAVSLALRLEQTAAQFVNDPHGECEPCM